MSSSAIRPSGFVESKVSSYDRFSSLLIASIIMVGFLVLALLAIWLNPSSSPNWHNQGGVIFPPQDPDGEDGIVINDEFEADLSDPSGSTDPQLPRALQTVQTAISNVLARQESGGKDGKGGLGSGDGVRKPGGIDRETPGILPDYARWKLTYEVDNLGAYKELLDDLGIQIGVVHPVESRIARVGNVSTKPIVISSDREQESETLRFSHSRLRLKGWDVLIARKAGVRFLNEETPIVQFFPEELRVQISRAEVAFLKSADREVEEVVQTNIRIEKVAGKFQFVVTSCEFE